MKLSAASLAAVATIALVSTAPRARATGFEEVGSELRPRDKTELELHGAFRTRAEVLSNLDLDRGLTPSGQPLFPVPASGGQNLVYADQRFRTDFAAYAPFGGVAVKAGSAWLDGAPLAYLQAQLDAFAAGDRHNDISQQMRNVARNMTAAEITQAAHYYAGQ